MEGADLDPLGVDRDHGGFEVTELLLLLGVKPALTTGFWWWFVVAAVLIRHGAESGEGELSRQIEDDPPGRRKWAGLLKLV